MPIDVRVAEALTFSEGCIVMEDTRISKRRAHLVRQIAALPVRRSADGELLVLLVTSRETRRWIIPKGWPWDDRADHLAAGEEAWEEAGVRGTLGLKPLGSFRYDKRRRDGVTPVIVSVYLLDVADVADTWPESHQRERAWFSVADAAALIEEPELRDVILALKEDHPGT